jgi:hypothetical protein
VQLIVNGMAHQSPEHPLGVGGEQLHDWLVPLKAFRESHGEEGGEVNASTPFAEDILGGAGATIMGRNMFGGGPGPWDESWKGWWGVSPWPFAGARGARGVRAPPTVSPQSNRECGLGR